MKKKRNRDELIAIYRGREKSGLTWRELGRKFGVSASTARREYFRAVSEVLKRSSCIEETRRILLGEGE